MLTAFLIEIRNSGSPPRYFLILSRMGLYAIGSTSIGTPFSQMSPRFTTSFLSQTQNIINNQDNGLKSFATEIFFFTYVICFMVFKSSDRQIKAI